MAAATPMTSAILPAKGASVTIAGHKFSWDAILIAAAGLVGVFFLYKAGQPVAGTVVPGTSTDTSGGSASLPGGFPDPSLSTLNGATPSTAPPVFTYSNAGAVYAPPALANAAPTNSPGTSTGDPAVSIGGFAGQYAAGLTGPPAVSIGGFAGQYAASLTGQTAYQATPAQPSPGPSVFAGIAAAAQQIAASLPAYRAPAPPAYSPPTPVAGALPGGYGGGGGGKYAL